MFAKIRKLCATMLMSGASIAMAIDALRALCRSRLVEKASRRAVMLPVLNAVRSG